MNTCHCCPKQGVILLETIQFNPPQEEMYWYCVECAMKEEKRVEKNGFYRHKAVIPILGMPATERLGSDCYPATVIDVSRNGKRVKVQQNEFKAAPGSNYYTEQRHDIDPEPSGGIRVYTLRKNGSWVVTGGALNCGQYLSLGFRRAYQDPHF